MLDRKQIREILLFKFKMGHKAAETTYSINKIIGPGTADEHSAVVVQQVLQRRQQPCKLGV